MYSALVSGSINFPTNYFSTDSANSEVVIYPNRIRTFIETEIGCSSSQKQHIKEIEELRRCLDLRNSISLQ